MFFCMFVIAVSCNVMYVFQIRAPPAFTVANSMQTETEFYFVSGAKRNGKKLKETEASEASSWKILGHLVTSWDLLTALWVVGFDAEFQLQARHTSKGSNSWLWELINFLLRQSSPQRFSHTGGEEAKKLRPSELSFQQHTDVLEWSPWRTAFHFLLHVTCHFVHPFHSFPFLPFRTKKSCSEDYQSLVRDAGHIPVPRKE